MIRRNHDEIKYWNIKIEEFHRTGMSPRDYCREYQVYPAKFATMRHRIEFISVTQPERYKAAVPIVREFMESAIKPAEFVQTHDIDVGLLCNMATHLRYRDIIEEVKPMEFIQVPINSVQGAIAKPQILTEPEVVKPQNPVELIISSGVKVVVAPDVGADKLIRIIEFLKDL